MPFIVIFFYITLTFGMMDWASDTTYRLIVLTQFGKTPFELNMGNFNSSDLNFLYFMFASVINEIIILNLLILEDFYDKFQAEADYYDNMGRI